LVDVRLLRKRVHVSTVSRGRPGLPVDCGDDDTLGTNVFPVYRGLHSAGDVCACVDASGAIPRVSVSPRVS
jgi:hypothetical protein